jgi:hypothetical protein
MSNAKGSAKATKIDAAVKARATLKSIGLQKDRTKTELALLLTQAQTGQSRQGILAAQIARRHAKVGGQKLADALEAFNLTFDGINGGPRQ